jgi:HD-GYP domain-containing protein (c-di-GMP phosphodiesterase class II)
MKLHISKWYHGFITGKRNMIIGFLKRSSLLFRFSLIFLLVISVIAAVLAWRLESTLQNDILFEAAQNTAAQASNILDKNLTAADLNNSLQGQRYTEIDSLIHDTLLSANIVRIKIWNQNGMLVYADDQAIIGKIFPLSDELKKAFQGEIATDISPLTKAENTSERLAYNELYEIYVPLKLDRSSEASGAYEVYYDLARLQPRLTRIRNVVWGGVGLAFLLLYGTMFLLIRNASHNLIKSNQEIQRLLTAEQNGREVSETLERVSRALNESLNLRKLLDLICRESVEVFNTQAAFLWLLEGGELIGFAGYGPGNDHFLGMRFPIYDPHLLGARVARERKSILVNNVLDAKNVDNIMVELFNIKSMMGIPLIKGEQILGALMITDIENPQRFTEEDLALASIFGGHAALAIDNAQLFERAHLHLEHEKALREIDLAITSNLELSRILKVVLYQTRAQLEVDACSILLFDPDTQTLEYHSGQGFQTDIIQQTHIHLGEGRVGSAALKQQIFGRAEIESSRQIPDRAELIILEKFAAYFMAPLVTKDKLLGVMEIYHHAPLVMTTEWLKFLETLAGQAAIAIENSTLFQNLQQSNLELSQAYDATIEGWSAALDLRDRETEGHTRRVTEMSVRLAKRMGLNEQQQVHVRRGALLHDIGKMGVPDRILLKPDSLTKDEQAIMQMHPTYAHQMLKHITYLKQSLDIPLCHHEKWDGSGYPRGLAGEDIPLTARIFCIVDVYDALTSDRPYRMAWPEDKVLEHIEKLSGTHFEPRVVEAFLAMLREEQPAPN